MSSLLCHLKCYPDYSQNWSKTLSCFIHEIKTKWKFYSFERSTKSGPYRGTCRDSQGGGVGQGLTMTGLEVPDCPGTALSDQIQLGCSRQFTRKLECS